ncbi:MAG: sulfatase-like hydrolase/transferase, partial [Planctomycetaceae bacterium]
HAPFVVPEEYSRPYKEAGIESPRAEFYGMITNLDENVARLRARLDELGLAENTILIFTTDNGTAAGARNGGFNAGMRGTKGSEYDGGHRVPCFVHWPGGGWTGGRDIDRLTAHIDWLPTLVEICGLERPKLKIDGTSLVPLLAVSSGHSLGAKRQAERTLFVHSQRIDFPEKWRKSAVMTDRWRLINGKELYDIQADPAQQHDIAQKHPQVVAELRTEYDDWWNATSARFDDYVRITLGSPAANPTHLTCHDWHAPIAQVPWNQTQIERDPLANGTWAVEVDRPGRYEITLRTRPKYVDHPLSADKARVKIGDVEAERDVPASATEVTIALELDSGPAMMQTWLESADGQSRGAYFVEVRRVE